jgi:purine nucleosidase
VLLADALAMAVALQPDIVRRVEQRHVRIELAGVDTRGATIVDRDGRLARTPNVEIVHDVDQARFEALVASALGAG